MRVLLVPAPHIALFLKCYRARRWHQRCQLKGTEASVRPRFMAVLGQDTTCL
jgi:hypothetical protein